jgi:hypothetical protein
LGYEAGKGDLRDCVVGYVQSDPEQKADYRLVFREIGPGATRRQPTAGTPPLWLESRRLRHPLVGWDRVFPVSPHRFVSEPTGYRVVWGWMGVHRVGACSW